jgi:hypothetical protein
MIAAASSTKNSDPQYIPEELYRGATHLGNSHARTRNHHRRRRRHIIRVPAIPTRTDDIHRACKPIALFIRISIVPLARIVRTDGRRKVFDLDGVFAQDRSACCYDAGRGVKA